jgi:hypothetical protein
VVWDGRRRRMMGRREKSERKAERKEEKQSQSVTTDRGEEVYVQLQSIVLSLVAATALASTVRSAETVDTEAAMAATRVIERSISKECGVAAVVASD